MDEFSDNMDVSEDLFPSDVPSTDLSVSEAADRWSSNALTEKIYRVDPTWLD